LISTNNSSPSILKGAVLSQWGLGADRVHLLLAQGDLQKIQGAETNGQPLLYKAFRTLASANALRMADPDSSYTLAYDAARFAGTALLAQQGLRPTTKGGHYAVEQVVRAQFQTHFQMFGTLRRRRNELEYPSSQDGGTTPDEAAAACESANAIAEAAAKLLPHLGFF
jgi:hypothetical protein